MGFLNIIFIIIRCFNKLQNKLDLLLRWITADNGAL